MSIFDHFGKDAAQNMNQSGKPTKKISANTSGLNQKTRNIIRYILAAVIILAIHSCVSGRLPWQKTKPPLQLEGLERFFPSSSASSLSGSIDTEAGNPFPDIGHYLGQEFYSLPNYEAKYTRCLSVMTTFYSQIDEQIREAACVELANQTSEDISSLQQAMVRTLDSMSVDQRVEWCLIKRKMVFGLDITEEEARPTCVAMMTDWEATKAKLQAAP